MLEIIFTEIKQIEMNNKKFRQFGIVIGIIVLLIAVFNFLIKDSLLEWFIVLGLLLLVLGVIYPKILAWPYKVWMLLSVLLGLFFSNIILTVLYYIIFVPIAVLLKITKKDLLDIRIDKSEESFWKKREDTFNNMENLY